MGRVLGLLDRFDWVMLPQASDFVSSGELFTLPQRSSSLLLIRYDLE